MRFLYLCLLFLVSYGSIAQRPQRSSGFTSSQTEGQDRIAQIKIAKLTTDMKMSKAQAEKFWPIYHSFDAERRDVRREIRALSRNISEDDDAYRKQEKIQELKQKELDLTKRYKGNFLKVISEQQYGMMLTSEERFNQTLLDRLKERNKDE